MRSPIAYVPRRGPLGEAGALAATAFLGSLALVAFVTSNPIVLGGVGLAAASIGLAAGAGRALVAAVRWGAALGVLVVAVNGLVSQRGETILVRGWELPLLGRLDVSAEALAEGGVLALRIAVVLAVFAVHSACVDPDRVMRLLRPVARHSALTATLIARLVPLAAADHARLREAARLRGPAAAPVGSAAILRRLVAGSLDRAVDVAATLELRGYAHGAPRRVAASRSRARSSWRFALAAAAIACAGIGARLAGFADFAAYPTLSLDASAQTLALAGIVPVLATLPFAENMRGRATRG